jgi:hypothetical protein
MAALGAFLTLIMRWFLGAFVRLFTMMANNFLATKIILGVLFVIILPIVLNNLIYDLMNTVFTTVNSYAATNAPTLTKVYNWTGLMGYFMNQLGIVQALTIVFSAMVCRFALSWIPFVGPK